MSTRIAYKSSTYLNNWVDYSLVSQNVSNNTSNVVLSFESQRNNSSTTTNGSAGGSYLVVDGTRYDGSGSYNFASGNITIWKNMQTNIGHNADGTKTLNVTANCWTHNATVGSQGEFYGSVGLPTIPRKSTINSINGSIAEENFSLSYSKASSSFSDDLNIYCAGVCLKSISSYVSGSNISFTDSELLSLYAIMGTATSCTLDFYLYTYNGSTNIGYSNTSATFYSDGTIYIDINSSIRKKANPYIAVNGSYKRCIAFEGVNGVWKRGHTQ